MTDLHISPDIELLPCPFCAGPAVNVGGEYITCGAAWKHDCAGHQLRCLPCDWNTRPDVAATPRAYRLDHPALGIELSIHQPDEDWAKRGWTVTPLYGADAQARQERSDLTKLAAECHRAKWEFDLSEDSQPSKSAARALITNAFNALHRIGDMALKLRDASSVPPTPREAPVGWGGHLPGEIEP
jgi:hypothetical protein